MTGSRASTLTFADVRKRSSRKERRVTFVEYGLALAIFLTAVGAIDSSQEQTPASDRSDCAGFERRGEWLDKDMVSSEVSAGACAAHRTGRAAGA